MKIALSITSIALCVLGLYSGSSLAIGDQSGTVTEIRVSSISAGGNPTHVMLSGTYSNAPSCATVGWWAFDTETTHGKNILAALLTAQSAGKTTRIWGNGTCNLRGDMETAIQAVVSE